MANINKLVKNKQFMWLGVIAVSAVAVIGGGMYLSDLEVGSDDAAQTHAAAQSKALHALGDIVRRIQAHELTR